MTEAMAVATKGYAPRGDEDPMATLCRMTVGLAFEDLPAEVVRHVKHTLLDSMAVTIGGSAMAGIPEIAALVKDKGGKPETLLPFYGGRVPASEAALAIGPMPRAMDCGDLHEEAGHVSEYVVAALLAATGLCERVSGKEFLTALAIGQEILIRIGAAYGLINRAIAHQDCGGHYIFGAVAAVGRLIGLTEDQLGHAQGIARTMTQPHTMGIYAPATLMVRVHHGLVCRAAITACELARAGITGPREQVLAGPKGFFAAARWETEPDAITRDLGTRWRLTEIITKGYSACYFSHSSIDGIRDQMRRHGFGPGDITRIHIDVSTPAWRAVCEPVSKKWQPETVPECQFSLPYAVATAAFDDRVFLDSYSETARSRTDVRELMTRITAHEGSSVSDWGTRLEVELDDGRVLREEYVHVKGHPANPFTERDFIEKFRMCVAYSAIPLELDRIERVIGDVLALEAIGDVSASLLEPLVPET